LFEFPLLLVVKFKMRPCVGILERICKSDAPPLSSRNLRTWKDEGAEVPGRMAVTRTPMYNNKEKYTRSHAGYARMQSSVLSLDPTLLLAAGTSRLHLASARCKRGRGGFCEPAGASHSLLSFFGLADIRRTSPMFKDSGGAPGVAYRSSGDGGCTPVRTRHPRAVRSRGRSAGR
jgi:hypothetical protein